MIQCVVFAVGPLLQAMSTSCPPCVHLASFTWWMRPPIFCCVFCSVYYTERKPKNKKRGRPGNEARLDLQFHMKAFEFTVNNKVVYIHTLQTMHFSHGLPSHLSFLTISKKKTTETSHKKVFRLKTGTCRSKPSKTNQTGWEWPTILHTIPTSSCAILPTMHTTKCTLASSPTEGMHNYTVTTHSALLTPQPSA